MILPAPMLLTERGLPPLDQPGWIYEIKFDGYRCMAGVVDGKAELRTRNGADCTKWTGGVHGPSHASRRPPHPGR